MVYLYQIQKRYNQMARKYDSSRRAANAERTKQSIIEAAVKMHGEENTTLAAVAEAAGVSLPTVSKYFPTKEDLFEACTEHVASHLTFPSPESLLEIENSGERLRKVVSTVYGLNEETFGQSWVGYTLEQESSVMAESMLGYEGLIASLAQVIPLDEGIGDQETLFNFVKAALSPLTYRALRLKNKLTLEESVEYMTVALAGVLNIET